MSAGHELPDATNGAACCMGSAVYGPSRCTCWTAEHDVAQSAKVHGPERVRDKMCSDCAFRPDSPERNGDARFAHSTDDDIESLSDGGNVFSCHQGMRRCLSYVHDNGTRVEAMPGDYHPGIMGGRAYKADGTPADLCAGWAAAKRIKDREAEFANAEREVACG